MQKQKVNDRINEWIPRYLSPLWYLLWRNFFSFPKLIWYSMSIYRRVHLLIFIIYFIHNHIKSCRCCKHSDATFSKAYHNWMRMKCMFELLANFNVIKVYVFILFQMRRSLVMWKEKLQSQLVLSYISLIILMQNYFKRKFQETRDCYQISKNRIIIHWSWDL